VTRFGVNALNGAVSPSRRPRRKYLDFEAAAVAVFIDVLP